MTSTTGLSTPVALKILRRDVSPASQAMQRLRDEGLLLAQLNHPTILKVHDLVLLEGRVSLVTEFVDGEDLEHCLRGSDRVSLRGLVEIVGQVASALDAAYNAPGPQGTLRLVHRDIKPTNVRISRHGEVKLLDFGIARTDELTREARTKTDVMVGSPPYMAPERFLDNELRSASDVFSLGATLLEGLIGRRVFDQPVTILATMAVAPSRYEDFLAARLALVPDTAPPEVVALVREMLRHSPEDRPTAGQVAARCEVLADVLEGQSLSRWCRARSWHSSALQTELGELDGRVVTEGTLARELPDPTPRPPRSPASEGTTPLERISIDSGPERRTRKPARLGPVRGVLFWLGGAGVASGAAMIAVGLLLLVSVLIFTPSSTRGKLLAPFFSPARTVFPESAPPAPPAAPVPDVEPEQPPPDPPEKEIPTQLPTGSPSGPPSGPPSGVAPPNEQPRTPRDSIPTVVVDTSPKLAQLSVVGDHLRAEVRLPSGMRALPASLPPGTYEVHVTFPSGAAQPVSVQMAGAPVVLECKARAHLCSPQ